VRHFCIARQCYSSYFMFISHMRLLQRDPLFVNTRDEEMKLIPSDTLELSFELDDVHRLSKEAIRKNEARRRAAEKARWNEADLVFSHDMKAMGLEDSNGAMDTSTDKIDLHLDSGDVFDNDSSYFKDDISFDLS